MLHINTAARIVNPAPVKPVSVAWMMGASDAEAGRPVFSPETYFVQRSHKIQYALGFEAVRGASEMTRQFTGSVQL